MLGSFSKLFQRGTDRGARSFTLDCVISCLENWNCKNLIVNQFFGDYSFLWRKIKFKYRISFWTKEWPSSVKSFYVCIDFKNDQWSHRANKMSIILTIVRGDLTKSIQILIYSNHSLGFLCVTMPTPSLGTHIVTFYAPLRFA